MNENIKAKELYIIYDGNYFQMEREGCYSRYKSYHISKEQEMIWAEELSSGHWIDFDFGNTPVKSFDKACSIVRQKKKESTLPLLLKEMFDTYDKICLLDVVELIECFSETLRFFKIYGYNVAKLAKSCKFLIKQVYSRMNLEGDTQYMERLKKIELATDDLCGIVK